MKHIRIINRERLGISCRWKLTATEKGTRQLGKSCKVSSPGNKFYFRGRPILDFGKIAFEAEGYNLVTTLGLTFISNALIDTSAVYDTGLTYCAEGTDDTAPAAGDTALGAEAARKTITSRTISGSESTFSTFFTAAEANDAIKEAGLFGGSNASAGSGTGILFSHWAVVFDNSLGAYDVTMRYVLSPSYT